MVRRFGLVLATVLAGTLGGTAQEGAKKDREDMQGAWTVSRFVLAGQDSPEDLSKKITFVVDGDKLIVKLDSSVLSEGTFVLDPGKNPKQIDVTSTAGPDKGQTKLGIYEIDGDMLKTCFYVDDSSTKKRPAEFASAKDSLTSLAVMKRMKK
jgi:uncharacterized protein (TIGR03067 family)